MTDESAAEVRTHNTHEKVKRLAWYLKLVDGIGYVELPLMAIAAALAATVATEVFPIAALGALAVAEIGKSLALRSRKRLATELEELKMQDAALSEKVQKLTADLTVGGPAG